MSDRSIANSLSHSPPGRVAAPAAAHPVAARTRLLLEGAILPTLLRLSPPNILNLPAIAGMITCSSAASAQMPSPACRSPSRS